MDSRSSSTTPEITDKEYFREPGVRSSRQQMLAGGWPSPLLDAAPIDWAIDHTDDIHGALIRLQSTDSEGEG
jgi:hypothetical protein